jgi:transposase
LGADFGRGGQSVWAAGLAALLVEVNAACDEARRSGWRQLGLKERRSFTKRYDDLVAMGLAANKEPAHRKRNPVERRSFNLATAFATHKSSILRFMTDLQVPLTNNQAERDLRPSKLHRKVLACD